MYTRRGIGNSGQETVSRLESGDERWNKPIRDTRDRGWETGVCVGRQSGVEGDRQVWWETGVVLLGGVVGLLLEFVV